MPIEIKKRELDPQLCLAYFAAKRGYRVYIGSHEAIYTLIESSKEHGGILLEKSVPHPTMVKRISSLIDHLSIMDAEMSPILESQIAIKVLRGRLYGSSLKFVNSFLVPGPTIYSSLKKALSDERIQIVTAGWPRIDIWQHYAQSIYERKSKGHVEKFGEFLLFASTFGDINSKTLHLTRDADETETEPTFLVKEKRSERYQNFIKLIEILTRWDQMEDVPPIVVRPHPSESVRIWKRATSKLRKTYVVDGGDITSLILASKGVIHTGSTVSLQTQFMGKKSFLIKDVFTSHAGLNPLKLSEYIASELNPPKLNGSGVPFGRPNPEYDKALKSKLVFSNQSYAINAILDYFEGIVQSKRRKIKMSRVLSSYFSRRAFIRFLGLSRDELFWFLGRNLIAPQLHKIPYGIKRSDVELVVKNIEEQNNVSIARVKINCWEIWDSDK